jgi:hypothetical protein
MAERWTATRQAGRRFPVADEELCGWPLMTMQGEPVACVRVAGHGANHTHGVDYAWRLDRLERAVRLPERRGHAFVSLLAYRAAIEAALTQFSADGDIDRFLRTVQERTAAS